MATGASTCDLAILLIDARKGVLDQTRRHSFIATLLGIRHLVVAVNKMDLGYRGNGVRAVQTGLPDLCPAPGDLDIKFVRRCRRWTATTWRAKAPICRGTAPDAAGSAGERGRNQRARKPAAALPGAV